MTVERRGDGFGVGVFGVHVFRPAVGGACLRFAKLPGKKGDDGDGHRVFCQFG